MGHRDFCCDGCQTHNLHGRRFHCLRCVNYDLCLECYDHNVETLNHRFEHPMQLLHDHQLADLLPNGELLELMHLPNCYTCPYCGIFGHTAKELIDHVITMHRQDDGHVVCPMCAGLPGIQLVAIRNLARHLLLNHIEHANLLDPHTPPLRHALARLVRRCRRQQPLPPPSSSSDAYQMGNLATHNSSRIAANHITYQLSELRRLRPEPNSYPEADPRLRPTTTLAITSGDAEADPEASQLAVESSDADRYLLQQWMMEQHAKLEQADPRNNRQRQQHALFVEHLLLSMLCEEHLQLPAEPKISLAELHESRDTPLDGRQEDVISLLSCKCIPSQIMMLMSLPWIRPWSTQSKKRYIEMQGVTLDESEVTAGEKQQDID
ncbi:E3 ubiquitin-protein ligase KCMF1 [Drosophila grimshawi]|uniref:E3 ubiquitin-protein ligase KCMF1 n=1 Tax=Drosophila grimshawi TaxID=7222 RepID=B4JAM7_DROGR|nr:E3 ubiquitin-protein ligase KCMF1 [Drosophila grimshawi]EDW02813.1 GH10832 [Drosophila grimshawi]